MLVKSMAQVQNKLVSITFPSTDFLTTSILESSVRSFSNLLERLHHSFWFYFIPYPGRFLLLSIYIAPVALVSAALLFHGLKYWWRSNSCRPYQKPLKNERLLSKFDTKHLNSVLGLTAKKYFVAPDYIERFSQHDREYFLPLLSILICHIAGLALLWLPVVCFSLMQTGSPFILASCAISIVTGKFIVPFVVSTIHSQRNPTPAQIERETLLLAAITSTELGLGLCSISTLNPSLSLALAVPSVPVFLILFPGKSRLLNILQEVLLVLLNPIILFAIVVGIQGVEPISAASRLVEDAVFNFGMYGAWIFPISCWFQSCLICGLALVNRPVVVVEKGK